MNDRSSQQFIRTVDASSMKGDMGKFESIQDHATQRTAVVVVGDASSAAVAVGGLLEYLGCDAPASKCDDASQIAELSDAVLQSSGTLSDDWATFNAKWLASPKATEFIKRAVGLLQTEFGDSHLAVMQDAGTARLLPFWNRVFDRTGIVPRYLFTVTDPAKTAEDLLERLNIGLRTGHLIWLRAALEAEAHSRGRLRAFADVEQLSRAPAKTMNSLANSLRLTFPRDVQTAFVSQNRRLKQFRQSLRPSEAGATSGSSSPVTADWVTATYQIFRDWAATGETAEAQTVLDAIREAFDEAVPAFLGVGLNAAPSGGDASPDKAKLQDLEQELESAREVARAEIDDLRKTIADQGQALEDGQEELRARYSEIVTLTRMLASETAEARKFERNAKRLGEIARAFERGGTARWIASILPWGWHLRRIKRRIERETLFDCRAYLAANRDVASAGVDPLRHYLVHGASEGRPLGIE